MIRVFPSILVVALIATISGCVSLKEETDPTRDWSADRLYQEAKSELAQNNYETAIEYLEKLEARYPYGAQAAQAQLEVAYAYYRDNEPALAIAAAERFVRLHPTHPFVDYAYYLKGLVNFNVKRGAFDFLLGRDADYSDRDPEAMRESLASFRELIRRFPDSKYAADAQQRIVYLVNISAKHEIHIARYYFERGAYVATVNRCKYVLEQYGQTPSIEDALGLLALSYAKMGYGDLMHDSVRVLKLNFPASTYLKRITALQEGGERAGNDAG
jgi:outer membrane protein assembly factor BamD